MSNNDKEALILSGGLGTRLRKFLPSVPKSMAPINGIPFLTYPLNYLANNGFSRVVISTGYMSEHIKSYFGSSYKALEIVYSTERTPLGTGGAIKKSLEICTRDYVLVLNGDTLLEIEIQKLYREFQSHGRPILVAVKIGDTSRYGRMEIEDSFCKNFQGKGVKGPGFINAGCYLLPRNFFEEFDLSERFSFEEDFLSHNREIERFKVFISEGYFIDIGTPTDYDRARRELIKR